jgi:diguanylate cyclase (GGDEF)-like protein/PAS domain S-box-containing protein
MNPTESLATTPYSAFDLLHTLIWICDLQTLQIQWANQSALKLWQLQSLDPLCSQDLSVIADFDPLRLSEYLARFQQGQTVQERWRFYPPGQPIEVECHCSSMPSAEGQSLMLIEGRMIDRVQEDLLGLQSATLEACASSVVMTNQQEIIQWVNPALSERKQMEEKRGQAKEALRQSEARFRGIFETAAIGIGLTTLEGDLLDCNTATLRMLGYSREELHNLNFRQYSHPDDLAEDLRLYEELLAGRRDSYQMEKRYIRKNGQIFWGRLTVAVLRDCQGEPLYTFGMLEDINDRKLVEQTLLEERQLFMAGPTVVFQWRAVDGWLVEYVSQNVYDQLGYVAEDFIQRISYGSLIHPDDMERVAQEVQAHTQAGLAFFEQEYRLRHANGDYRWFYDFTTVVRGVEGEVVRYLGYVQDITERKQTEADLQASQALWQYALEGSGDGVWDWNVQTNQVFFSPRWREMLGFAQDEIEPSLNQWLQLLHPDDRASVQEAIDQYFRGETAQYAMEYRIQCRDGTYRWHFDRGRVVQWTDDHRPLRMIGTNVDITKQKQTEETLRSVSDRLQMVLSTSPAVIYTLPPGDIERIMFISENLTTLTGYDPNRVVRDPDWFVNGVHPDDWEHLNSQSNQWFAEGASDRLSLQYRFRKADGSWIWLDDQLTAVRDADGTVVELVGAFVDITAQIESDRRLERISRHVPGVIYQYRLGSDGSSHFPYASQGIQDFSGVSPEVVRIDAAPVLAVVHPEDRERVSQSIQQSAQTLTLWQCEYRIRQPDGQVIWLSGQATPEREPDGSTLWHGYIMDITDRKQAEERLRHSEATKQAMLEAIPDLLIRINRDGIRLDFISGGEIQVAPAVDPTLPQSIYETLPQAVADLRMHFIHQALETRKRQIYQHEIEINGELHHEEVRIVPINADEVLVMVRDITDRVMAETALRESEARWQFALEGSGDGVWDWDVPTDRLFVSRQWKKILGHEEHDAIGNSLDEWDTRLHPEDKAKCYEALDKHFNGETSIYQHEYRLRCKDGTYKWVLDRGKVIQWTEDGKPLRMIGTHSDITNRRSMEEALRESESRFRSAFDYAAVGMALVAPSGQWLQVNPALCQMLGYAQAEMLALNFQSLTHPDDLAVDLIHLEQMLRGEIQICQIEKRYIHKQGHIVWAILSVSLVCDVTGQPLYFVSQIQNISDRKQAELSLQKQKEFLQAIFDYIPILLVFFNPQGQVELVNREMEQVLGWNLTDWQQQDILAACYPDKSDYEVVMSAMKRATKQWNDVKTRTADGRILVVSWTTVRLSDGSRIGIGQDITSRKYIEERLRERAKRDRLMSIIIQRIRQSLNLNEILNTTVSEIRQILQTDRVLVYRFNVDGSGVVIAESVGEKWMSLLGERICDEVLTTSDRFQAYQQGQIQNTTDIYDSELPECYVEMLARFQVRATLVLPILHSRTVWGLLAVQHCSEPRVWQSTEIELLTQLSNQVAIGIQQSELYQQLQQANQELQHLATHDQLTQLANRRYFDDYFYQEWHRALREQIPLTVVLCDIDHFKDYNDTYGHLAGDRCLAMVAEAIRKTIKRPADLAARYGGEEFAIILPNTDSDGAIQVAEAICREIKQLKIPHAAIVNNPWLTMSLGIACKMPMADTTPQQLLNQADQSLYKAKEAGRDRYCMA